MRSVARSLAWITIWLALVATLAGAQTFHLVVLGDRTGEAQPGVYEEVWKEAAAEAPAFVVTAGDTVEGLDDATAESEWRAIEQMLKPYRRIPFYPAPGNHDIWSPASERLFRQHTGHEPHYGFDYQQAHFTILDNSRSDELSPDEMAFLEKDLATHAAQPVKFIVSHRPSWLIDAVARNPNFALHQLARKYGVQTVIAGHVHEMLQVDLDGIRYISMPSAGGHLRGTHNYEDGWFFGFALVEVSGREVKVQIKELKPPLGRGRLTSLDDWGAGGLTKRPHLLE
ncbi:MAG TPA: metallophosphoesterase [Bryobacteraceae bacterium]|nr:metallophosphoesterase [Bryobacteraceae bacterium]